MIVFNDGWAIRTEGEYLFVKRKDKPGEILVKAEDEGFVVEVWPEGEDVDPEQTMGIFYTDLEEDDA